MDRAVAIKNPFLLHDAPYPMRRQALGLLSPAEAIQLSIILRPRLMWWIQTKGPPFFRMFWVTWSFGKIRTIGRLSDTKGQDLIFHRTLNLKRLSLVFQDKIIAIVLLIFPFHLLLAVMTQVLADMLIAASNLAYCLQLSEQRKHSEEDVLGATGKAGRGGGGGGGGGRFIQS